MIYFEAKALGTFTICTRQWSLDKMIPTRRASYRGVGPLGVAADSSYLYPERLIAYKNKTRGETKYQTKN